MFERVEVIVAFIWFVTIFFKTTILFLCCKFRVSPNFRIKR
ncbi:hypothetical protein KHA80_05235 [Anaerobacillus sp. HL2]|nr:hypothetical protein KHA80_05235 [Anaerobacillus sp. HL2]